MGRIIAGMMILATACSLAAAQEVLTLDQATNIALERNQMLLGAAHEREAARWGTLNAYTNFLPKVQINASATRIDPETERRANGAIDFINAAAGPLGIPPSALANIKPFAYRDAFFTGVTVVQPIYNGGAEFVGLDAAYAQRARSDYSYEDTQQDVIARVKGAYYTVLKAEALVNLSKEAAERTRRYLEMTRRRADLGMRTTTDVLRWEVQLASDEGTIIQAENGLAAARLQLNEVMGVDLETPYRLVLPASVDSILALGNNTAGGPLLASLGNVQTAGSPQSIVIDNHPSLQMMQATLALADVQVDQAWVNFKPRLNLAFLYGWESNNTPQLDGIRPWSLSLVFSWPIFNGFGDYTSLQRARADVQKTETQLESFRRGLMIQARSAELSLHAAKKRIEIARKGQQEAMEVLQSVTRRYDNGGASNVDLIDVQTAYTSARTNYITAIYEYSVAQIQFARATGTITR